MTKLNIDILGEHFTIQANEDEEYLNKLHSYYQRITNDIRDKNKIENNLRIAILSGIMLCDELYKEKQNKIAMENGTHAEFIIETEEEISRKTQEMIDKIDKVL